MNKKELQEDFASILFQRYFRHCDREDEDMYIQHFTEYLVDCGIIKERTVKRFMVNELYPEALAACGGRKLEAISLLHEKTGMPERTIRFMVDNPERYGLKV